MKHPAFLTALLLAAGNGSATVLNVPADYPTIQAAIDAAAPGDTVLVADGAYSGPGNVNIDTLGKAMTVKSAHGRQATWIDCEFADHGFLVQSGEAAATIIQGFEIDDSWDANILVSGSSPTIIDCSGSEFVTLTNSSAVVTNSYFDYGFEARGGGPTFVGCVGSLYSSSSALILSACDFSDNPDGVGLAVSGGSVQANQCKFNNNGNFGGGVILENCTATLVSCDLSGNQDDTDGAEGGGIAMYGSTASLTGCTITNNQVGLEGQGFGGGAYIDPASEATMVACLIDGNVASDHGGFGGWGGGVFSQGQATIANGQFIANYGVRGGGLCSSGADLIVNCTFFGNFGGNQGKAIAGVPATTVANCIIVGNGSGPIYGNPAVTFSDVEGGYTGTGNINAAPKYIDPADGDFRLAPGSPCIDAGDNTAVPGGVTTDFGGLARFVDDPATSETGVGPPPVVDMGSHEFQGACYADFTNDGLLNLFDFLAYVNAFNAGDAAADCDDNPGLDLFDFLCFTNAFNAGCG